MDGEEVFDKGHREEERGEVAAVSSRVFASCA